MADHRQRDVDNLIAELGPDDARAALAAHGLAPAAAGFRSFSANQTTKAADILDSFGSLLAKAAFSGIPVAGFAVHGIHACHACFGTAETSRSSNSTGVPAVPPSFRVRTTTLGYLGQVWLNV